ncbi:MAG: hypothetical protein FJ221_07850 [Lentisphaerae bacterium]|nr:hypothetical protein [Lentisphaerota bacterium]
MKPALLASMLVLCAFFAGCDGDDAPGDRHVTFAGTVSWKALETGFYAIDADDGQGYEPINLPAEYSVDGLRVQVSAILRNDMASINMYGIIIEITEISRLN